MPGDEWQKLANLRAYYGLMFCHPGKKLLFMGAELAQHQEWNHDRSLDWHLLQKPAHAGVQKLVRDLNALYRCTPALYEIDFRGEGFEWLDWEDRANSVFSWIRRDKSGSFVLCVANLTPVVRHGYRVGVPQGGTYNELLNTDGAAYGGSNLGNAGVIVADAHAHHDRSFSLALTLPPLATLILVPA
jgi:1,4-alpha-glucan branching enzyme